MDKNEFELNLMLLGFTLRSEGKVQSNGKLETEEQVFTNGFYTLFIVSWKYHTTIILKDTNREPILNLRTGRPDFHNNLLNKLTHELDEDNERNKPSIEQM